MSLFQVFDNVQSSDPFPIIIRVINADDEPPVFINSNTFGIKEENVSQVGQVVFRVEAVNEDAVPGTNSAVVYGLSGGSVDDVFQMNPETGEITLLRVVDREASGESEFVLLVTATEVASNLANVMELRVTVEDINDHVPYFDESSLRVFVDENLPTGSLVMTEFARDDDFAGPPSFFGSIVRYSMVDGTCDNLFSVEPEGGIVVQDSQRLDRETLNFPL